jgi:hypothetical protein
LLLFCCQVEVGEDEPEDIAVRKFMKKVLDSRVIEQVRQIDVRPQAPVFGMGYCLKSPICCPVYAAACKALQGDPTGGVQAQDQGAHRAAQVSAIASSSQ